MKDSASKNDDEEGMSFLTMSITVSDTLQTRSKASHQYNCTKGSKNTNENADFILSPSETSLPNDKIVGNLLHSYKNSGSVESEINNNGGNMKSNTIASNPFHQTINSVEMPLQHIITKTMTETQHNRTSKLYRTDDFN
jgi:hypothetical protein